MIDAELAARGKEHGLSPIMTDALFWALRYLRAGSAVHFRPDGRDRCTTLAIVRRGLAERARDFGFVLTERGQMLAERLFI